VLKRLFDILFSAFVLLGLSPLLVAIAVWVKLTSPGPVFFRQSRVGQHGKEFKIFKYRTMVIDAQSKGPQITIGADSRITTAGVLLRKYKLDELPQFLNVLRGEMSVVGPRPEVPRYVSLYPANLRNIVLSVRPGITDSASVTYRSESELLAQSANPEKTYVDDILPKKLQMYKSYVENQSLIGDLLIIIRTIAAVLGLVRVK
jgi:lipopolysaccharide/colanic/teichoic acid biosynthesis glycosyltransferase